MRLPKLGLLLPFLVVGGCTDWDRKFSEECGRVADLEVYEPKLWRDYVLQTIEANPLQPIDQHPRQGPHNVLPRWNVGDFHITNDWVRLGRPKWWKYVIYDNDHYLIDRKSGALVAKARNVHLSLHGFASGRSLDCIFEYPALYD